MTGSTRAGVLVTVTRFVDPDQPGWLECALTDAAGRAHFFIEKVPVVTEEDLDESSAYPRSATLACEVLDRRTLADGSERVTIDTARPWGIASIEGVSRFVVAAELVVVG